MAFCPKCGKELADGEVCECTKNTEVVQNNETEKVIETVNEEGGNEEASVEVKSEKKLSNKMIGIIAAAALVVLLFIIIGASGSKKYMKPIDNYLKAFNAGKDIYSVMESVYLPQFATLLDASVDLFYSDEDTIYYDTIAKRIDNFSEIVEDMKDEYPKAKFKFEFDKAKKVKDKDIKDANEQLGYYWENYLEDIIDKCEDVLDDDDELEDAADNSRLDEKALKKYLNQFIKTAKSLEKVKVKDLYEVKGKFILAEGKEELATTEKITFYIANVNGNWVLFDMDYSNSFYKKVEDESEVSEYTYMFRYLLENSNLSAQYRSFRNGMAY